MIRCLSGISALRQPAARRYVHLAPQNRLQPARPRVVVKDHRREHVPVLGHADRRHIQRLGLIEQLVDPARAVEQRELRVEMKVNEFGHFRYVIVRVVIASNGLSVQVSPVMTSTIQFPFASYSYPRLVTRSPPGPVDRVSM